MGRDGQEGVGKLAKGGQEKGMGGHVTGKCRQGWTRGGGRAGAWVGRGCAWMAMGGQGWAGEGNGWSWDGQV
jgi:hypothetical protein